MTLVMLAIGRATFRSWLHSRAPVPASARAPPLTATAGAGTLAADEGTGASTAAAAAARTAPSPPAARRAPRTPTDRPHHTPPGPTQPPPPPPRPRHNRNMPPYPRQGDSAGRRPGAVPRSGPLHAEPGHQVLLLRRRRGLVAVPQVVQGGEVGVHGRGGDDQDPGRAVRGVAEGVRGAAGHQHEPLGADSELLVLDDDRHLAVEDEVRLRAVDVPVGRRPAAARRQGALHQRQVAVVELGPGL